MGRDAIKDGEARYRESIGGIGWDLQNGRRFLGNRADTAVDVQTETPPKRATADLGGTKAEIATQCH